MFDSIKKLMYLLKHTDDVIGVLNNFIFNPIDFEHNYDEEKLFQDNLKSRWDNVSNHE